MLGEAVPGQGERIPVSSPNRTFKWERRMQGQGNEGSSSKAMDEDQGLVLDQAATGGA